MVIASRKLGNCVAAAAAISASTGRTALPVEFHAGRWADCDRLIEVVYREFGRCDVLVNNAGMSRSTRTWPRSPRSTTTRSRG